MVDISSSASRYNPTFYAVVGTVARPFSGVASLYAMRVCGAVLCALLLAAAAAATAMWAQTAWPAVGLLLAVTPVTVYSTVVAAPNGVELCAAALTWCAMLGLAKLGADHQLTPTLVLLALIGALPLTTVRSLGPLWLLAITFCVALVTSRAQLLALARNRAVRGATCLIGLATALALAWTLSAGTNAVGPGSAGDGSLGAVDELEPLSRVLPASWLLWCLQSVAAYPFRNQSAPGVVYVVAFVMMASVVVMASRAARLPHRLAMLSVVVLSSVVALSTTAITYPVTGTVIWQGRYGLPLSMGLFLLAGAALDCAQRWQRRAAPALVVAAAGVALQEAVSVVHVWHIELRDSPLAGSGAWVTAPVGWVVAGVLVGAAAGWAGLRLIGADQTDVSVDELTAGSTYRPRVPHHAA